MVESRYWLPCVGAPFANASRIEDIPTPECTRDNKKTDAISQIAADIYYNTAAIAVFQHQLYLLDLRH